MKLTRNQFRAVAKSRGYTLGEVATAWGLSAARLSQIAADPNRLPMYDCALWGLPPKRAAAAITARRLQTARAFADKTPRRDSPRPAIDPWVALVAMGAVFIVGSEQGDHLPEGCEGTVIAHEDGHDELHVVLLFETGYQEAFPIGWLKAPDCFLVATGRNALSSS